MTIAPKTEVNSWSIMALSAPHWEKRAAEMCAGLTSRTPFSLQNAIRVAARRALDGAGALGRSNWASAKGLGESVLLMEYWEEEKRMLEEKLRDIHPDLLFIGAMTPSFPGAVEVARLAKEVLRDVFVVLGGKHVNETFFVHERDRLTLDPHIRHARGSPLRLMQEGKIDPVFDLVCAGRCEELIAAIAERIGDVILHDKNPKETYGELGSMTRTVSGEWLAGWVKNGEIIASRSTGLPMDVDALPVPAETFGISGKFDVFGTAHTAHAFSESSLGCTFNCFFCSERRSINGQPRNPETAADRLLKQFKAIKQSALVQHDAASVSVFVEDSTFLGVDAKPDQLLRLAALMRAECFSIPFGGQFTVDQLLHPAIQRALVELKKVGLTYVFTGMETADEDRARAMSKNKRTGESWVHRNEQVIQFLQSIGVQYGIAVLFGLGEDQPTRLGQLTMIKDWQEQYGLPSVVSLNLATAHPLQRADGKEEDFTEWGVATDSPYLPILQRIFSESSERYPYAGRPLPTLDELREIEEQYRTLTLRQEVRGNAAERYDEHTMFDQDFYFDDAQYGRYLSGEMAAVHLNSASMAAPFPAVRERSLAVAEQEERLLDAEKSEILRVARSQAAALVGLPASMEAGVAFGRNTTEAASIVFWLAGLGAGDHVALTDGENDSIPRIFERHLDHGNPKRKDPWSAWPTHYSARGPRYPDFMPGPTDVHTSIFPVERATMEDIDAALRRAIGERTKMLLFSHVLRTTGRELPVRKICDSARAIKAEQCSDDPDLFILVDGAQSLGNVPLVDFPSLGCDAYVATPHKTMRSEVLGLLFFDPRNPIIQQNISRMNMLDPRTQQIILGGMFDARLGIHPNIDDHLSFADIAGFSAAVDELQTHHGLRGNDFSAIAARRQHLKDYCTEHLQAISRDLGIEIPPIDHPTSFILSIQLPSRDGRAIAQELSAHGIFLSYIDGASSGPLSHLLRISFQVDTTKGDIDAFIGALREVLK